MVEYDGQDLSVSSINYRDLFVFRHRVDLYMNDTKILRMVQSLLANIIAEKTAAKDKTEKEKILEV